jgi:hypothetical protein
MMKLEKYTGGGNINVLNRQPSGLDRTNKNKNEEYFYSYASAKLISFLEGLPKDENWYIGNMSKKDGGRIGCRKTEEGLKCFSVSHQNGYDVDFAIPMKGGKESTRANWGGYSGRNAFKPVPEDQIDTKKSLKLLKYAADKGASRVYLSGYLIDKIKEEQGTIPSIVKVDNDHSDHFHIRLPGSKKFDKGDSDSKEGPSSKEPDKKEKEPKEREKERKVKVQKERSRINPPRKFSTKKNDRGIRFEGFNEVVNLFVKNIELKRFFLSWVGKKLPNPLRIKTASFEMSKNARRMAWFDIRRYTKTSMSFKDFLNIGGGGERALKAYATVDEFIKSWNEGTLRRQYIEFYGTGSDEPFVPGLPVRESKKMKITKEKLAQIIKEEVEAYKASQVNEIDVDELEEAEAYIKEVADLLKSTYETIFKGAAPAVGTPQTKADTGEPVTDQTAHEDAKGLLLDLLGDAIDEFQQKEPELNEDGHDDVPSAVRAMKTMAEDALEMLDALEQMDGSLPTWWTNKMAVSASMLNKMRDYLLVPSMEEEMDEQ